jgi:glyoxylase-like metal-dependent hydrolase (beta-lactamase superfamily II)
MTSTSLQIGNICVESLVLEHFALDGGAMFGVVPRPLWEREFTADSQHRITLVNRALLLTNERDGYRALVDCGLGAQWTPAEHARLGFEPLSIEASLKRHGVALDSVTDLLLTHLHWDHAGALTELLARRHLRVHLGACHRSYALSKLSRDRASFRTSELTAAQDDRVELFCEGDEPLPSIRVRESHGHTPGLALVEVVSSDCTAIFATDLIPTKAHCRPAWAMAYDNHAVLVAQEKQALIERCAREQCYLLLQHDPHTASVQVNIENNRWITRDGPALTRASQR